MKNVKETLEKSRNTDITVIDDENMFHGTNLLSHITLKCYK